MSAESSLYFARTGETPQRVLTIRLGAVGDVLTTLPAIAALRRLLPNATIHHLVEEGAADVVSELPSLDDVIVVPRQQIMAELRRLKTKAARAMWSRLRAERYDLVVDFQNLLRSAVWTVATAAPHAIVRANWQEMSPLAFDFRVPCKPMSNVVQQHGNLLSVLSSDRAMPPLSACAPHITGAAWRSAAERLVALDVRAPYVVIAPGSRWPRRSLPHRLIEAGVRALRRAGVALLLVGGPSERGWLEALGHELRIPVSVDLTLKPLFAVIAGAAGIFCADSAPMHVADMLELPTTCVFGPSAPELYGPMFAPAVVVRDERYAGQHSFRGKDVDYFSGVGADRIERGIEHMLALPARAGAAESR